MSILDSKIPDGPLADKWTKHKNDINLVNPANKRLIDVIIVGTGLAGGSAAATLAELGYNVKAFCFQDSPRRAHSIAAQGGINAAKNYQGDGDSTYRLFYDTVKGGDYRSRESNVYRLAEVSTNIIDQCVAQGVPFAREYGGLLDNRSFGGVLVSRTFYAKGKTGQQAVDYRPVSVIAWASKVYAKILNILLRPITASIPDEQAGNRRGRQVADATLQIRILIQEIPEFGNSGILAFGNSETWIFGNSGIRKLRICLR